MELSPFIVKRRDGISALAGERATISQAKAGDPWIVLVRGATFKHADIDQAVNMAAEWVNRRGWEDPEDGP